MDPFTNLRPTKKRFNFSFFPTGSTDPLNRPLWWTALCCSPLSWGKDMERHLILPSRDAIERMDANGNPYHHMIWPCGIGPILKRKPAGEISRSDIFAAVMKSAASKQQQQLYSYNIISSMWAWEICFCKNQWQNWIFTCFPSKSMWKALRIFWFVDV